MLRAIIASLATFLLIGACSGPDTNHEVITTTQRHFSADRSDSIPVNTNLLLGSSSMAKLDVSRYLSCGPWLNRGIGNSEITHVIDYLDKTELAIEPKFVVLYLGENDISRNKDVIDVTDDANTLIFLLKKRFHSAHIVLLAIKPSPARQDYWTKFEEFNANLKTMAQGSDMLYFAGSDWQYRGNEADQYFIDDGVHLNHRGYIKLTAGINEICKSL